MEDTVFGVIKNVKFGERPKTEDEKFQDEAHEDALRAIRETLKEAKEDTCGRVVGVSIALVYADGSVGDKHSKVSGAPAMLGALEIAKYSRLRALENTKEVSVDLTPEDE